MNWTRNQKQKLFSYLHLVQRSPNCRQCFRCTHIPDIFQNITRVFREERRTFSEKKLNYVHVHVGLRQYKIHLGVEKNSPNGAVIGQNIIIEFSCCSWPVQILHLQIKLASSLWNTSSRLAKSGLKRVRNIFADHTNIVKKSFWYSSLNFLAMVFVKLHVKIILSVNVKGLWRLSICFHQIFNEMSE